MSDWKPDPNFSIGTPRLVISHFLPESTEHCQCLIDVYSSPGVQAMLRFNGVSLTVDTMDKARAIINGRIKAIHSVDGYGHYMISRKVESGGLHPVGIVNLIKTRPEYDPETLLPWPDVGFALTEEGEGKGYATEAGRALIDYAREHLRVQEVVGITQPHNTGSQRVLEKLGLERRGVMNLRMFPGKESVVYASPGLVDFAKYCDEEDSAADWKPDPSFAINTPRLVISHFLPESTEHCQCIIDVYSSPGMQALFRFNGVSLTVDTMDKARAIINGRIKAIHSVDGYGHYMISRKVESGGLQPVGLVNLIKTRPQCDPETVLPWPDVGFALTEEGKGYATEAGRALIDYAREHFGVKEVVGITQPHNAGSQRVLEKLGLERRGVMNLRMFPGKESVVYASPGLVDFAQYCVEEDSA